MCWPTMTLKKTDFEITQLICQLASQLRWNISSTRLFPQKPTLVFRATDNCLCGAPTIIRKTVKKVIATLDIGEFNVVEIQTVCTN